MLILMVSLDYVAGFLDADGSVILHRDRLKVVRFRFTGTDRRPIDAIRQAVFMVSPVKEREPTGIGTKPVFELSVHRQAHTFYFAKEMAKRTIIKRPKIVEWLERNNRPVPEFTGLTWGYVAGYFDGDGCVTFTLKPDTYHKRLIFYNTHRPSLQAIREFIDAGHIDKGRKTRTQLGSKTVYRLEVITIADVTRISDILKDICLIKHEKLASRLRSRWSW